MAAASKRSASKQHSSSHSSHVEPGPSELGWVTFAGAYMMLAGMLNLIWGIVALSKKSYFHESSLVFSSLNTWGVIVMIIGVLQFGTGVLVFGRRTSGMLLAILLAMCGILVNFLSIGAYPLWSCIAIACNALVLWAVTVHSEGF